MGSRFCMLVPAIGALIILCACSDRQAAPTSQQSSTGETAKRYGGEVVALTEQFVRAAYAADLEDVNRWDVVRRTADLLPPGTVKRDDCERALHSGPEAAEVRRQVMDQLADLDTRGLDTLLAELVHIRNAVPPTQPGPIHNWEHLHLASLRQASWATAVRAQSAIETGDHEAVIAAIEQILAMARLASHSPGIIGSLTCDAVTLVALERLRSYIRKGDTPPDALRQLAEAMDRQQPLSRMFALESERLMVLEAVHAVFHDPDRSPFEALDQLIGTPTDPEDLRLMETYLQSIGGMADYTETTAKFEQMHRHVMAHMYSLNRSSVEEIEELFRAFDDPDFKARFGPLAIFVPALNRFARVAIALDTLRNGHRLMLAIEIYRAEHGTYPSDLRALAPDYVDELPLDPCVEEPFKYRRLKHGEDELGREYLLYSVGLDGVDNGGRSPAAGARWSAGQDEAGFDRIINEP